MLVLVMLEKLCAAIEPDPTRKKKVFYMMVQELDRVGMLARRVPTSNASYRMIENAFYGQCSTPHPTPHTPHPTPVSVVGRWSLVVGRPRGKVDGCLGGVGVPFGGTGVYATLCAGGRRGHPTRAHSRSSGRPDPLCSSCSSWAGAPLFCFCFCFCLVGVLYFFCFLLLQAS